MKALYTLLILLIPFLSFSQLPDGTVAPNFTTTDVNGNEHTLYEYLDNGYTVILDISATWCGPCWNYHTGGTFEEIWEAHGPAGEPGVSPNTTDDVMILWFEGDAGTALSELENSDYGNWLAPDGNEVYYPISNDDNIASLYQLPYWPVIYTICPNRTLTESGQSSALNHYNNLDNCNSAINGQNLAILEVNSSLVSENCETNATGEVSVTVQNMGTEIISDYWVELTSNGQVIDAISIVGASLETYETTIFDFNITVSNGETIIIDASSINDVYFEDNYDEFEFNFGFHYANSSQLKIELLTDSYPNQNYLNITNDVEEVWSAGNLNVLNNFNSYDYWGNPPYHPNQLNDSQSLYNWEIGLSPGCYNFDLLDYSGDGLKSGTFLGVGQDGYWRILNNDNSLIDEMESNDNYPQTNSTTFLIPEIFGCLDELACNFNEYANSADGSCLYPVSYEETYSACNEFQWNGEVYNQSGEYTYTTSGSNGCDSIITLNLTIINSININLDITYCDEYSWQGEVYTESGTYTYETVNVNGCDSIINLNLSIIDGLESQTIIGQDEIEPFSSHIYALTLNENIYDWSVTNGNILSDNGNNIEVLWGEAGIGLIEVVETDENGCTITHSLQVNLGNNVENSWNCLNDACVDPLDGSGEYGSLNDCEANCTIVIEDSWNCLNDACVDPLDGSGEYSSLNDCEANCTIVIEDSWNCVNDACVDPLDGSGLFSTLNDCEQECQNISSINETLIDVNIYPNPSSNIFILEFNSDFEAEILVTNILGEQVYFETTQSNGEFNTQIDLSNYSKGIYNLTIKTSDGISNHKLILQ